MSDLQQTELVFVDGIAVFRPDSRQPLQHAVHPVRDAIARASAQHIHKLLVVITGIAGLEVPNLAMRFSIVREWAEAAGNIVSLAVVCRPEFIDPPKFGVTVAAGFGVVANVFDAEDDAIRWLLDLE